MKISDSEMKIMEIIWKCGGEMTSSEIFRQLTGKWAPTTILTFLKRLTDKGFLTVRKSGKTGYYSAAVNESEYKRRQTEEFIKEIHNGSVKSLLASLCGGNVIDKDKADKLKKWFEEQ